MSCRKKILVIMVLLLYVLSLCACKKIRFETGFYSVDPNDFTKLGSTYVSKNIADYGLDIKSAQLFYGNMDVSRGYDSTLYFFLEMNKCEKPLSLQFLVYDEWESNYYPEFRCDYSCYDGVKKGDYLYAWSVSEKELPSIKNEIKQLDILVVIDGEVVFYVDNYSKSNYDRDESFFGNESGEYVYKPVIYLYPEEQTDVNVSLDFDGELTSTYPKYDNGWNVTSYPDGTLIDSNGREYNYLFWEGRANDPKWDYDSYFCIPGDETMEFLEEYLAAAGLTDKEAADFISFWLPKMQGNEYNLIWFQTDAYEDIAKLNVSPSPDTVIRVYMVYESSDEYIESNASFPETPVREGFTVVEWGGTELTN